ERIKCVLVSTLSDKPCDMPHNSSIPKQRPSEKNPRAIPSGPLGETLASRHDLTSMSYTHQTRTRTDPDQPFTDPESIDRENVELPDDADLDDEDLEEEGIEDPREHEQT